MSPASVAHRNVRAFRSIDATRPMMKRPRVSIWRIGATTCSGKIDAPTASGSIGWNVE